MKGVDRLSTTRSICLSLLHSVSETKWHTSNDDWSMRSALEWLYNDAADDISIFFRAVSAL